MALHMVVVIKKWKCEKRMVTVVMERIIVVKSQSAKVLVTIMVKMSKTQGLFIHNKLGKIPTNIS